ncbi:hypothetical protein FQN54_000113 [Arachnomyces sp. PD_36]|nr:hypothetical protein FQN54_000113 [Arachnomyces sp. PD_36]
MSINLQKDLSWEGSLTGLVYKHLFVHPKPLPSGVSLEGKTAIVTGSNGGIGFEASRQLLQLGVHRLILAVRSQSRGDTAAAKLREEYPDARIDVSILDMADYDSVLDFVQRCKDLEHIDYAILNAGLQNLYFQRSDKTSHEMVFQVNYLSTALLALSLATTMKEKRRPNNPDQPPVLSVVSSDTLWLSRFQASTDRIISYMDNPENFSGFRQYMDSKLLIMLFIYQMARLISPDDVLVNVVNPGLVGSTNLGGETTVGRFMKIFMRLFTFALSRSPEVGASNYIQALVGEGKRSHGSFVSDWDIKPYPGLLYTSEGQALAEKLWKETMEELSFVSDRAIGKQFTDRKGHI